MVNYMRVVLCGVLLSVHALFGVFSHTKSANAAEIMTSDALLESISKTRNTTIVYLGSDSSYPAQSTKQIIHETAKVLARSEVHMIHIDDTFMRPNKNFNNMSDIVVSLAATKTVNMQASGSFLACWVPKRLVNNISLLSHMFIESRAAGKPTSGLNRRQEQLAFLDYLCDVFVMYDDVSPNKVTFEDALAEFTLKRLQRAAQNSPYQMGVMEFHVREGHEEIENLLLQIFSDAYYRLPAIANQLKMFLYTRVKARAPTVDVYEDSYNGLASTNILQLMDYVPKTPNINVMYSKHDTADDEHTSFRTLYNNTKFFSRPNSEISDSSRIRLYKSQLRSVQRTLDELTAMVPNIPKMAAQPNYAAKQKLVDPAVQLRYLQTAARFLTVSMEELRIFNEDRDHVVPPPNTGDSNNNCRTQFLKKNKPR